MMHPIVIWRTQIPFDVLPTMVHRSLTHGLLCREDVIIVADLPSRVRFVLTTDTLVRLGEISVEKLADTQTLIFVYLPDEDYPDDSIQATHVVVLASFRERLTIEIERRSRLLEQPMQSLIELVTETPKRDER